MAFLPKMRCSSRTWPFSARYPDAGTTSWLAAAAVSAPCAISAAATWTAGPARCRVA